MSLYQLPQPYNNMPTDKPLRMKTGKQAATYDKRDLLFSSYRTGAPLPPHPKVIGHANMVKQPWGMLGNDRVGDCVVASAAHLTMLWNAMAGKVVTFNEECVLHDYTTVTGYDPKQTDSNGDNPTDQGTNMRTFLNFWKNTGVTDASGNKHKIAAYVALEPGNVENMLEAMYLFGAVNIGVAMPASAQDQTQNNQIWDVVRNSPIEGGHCIPLVTRKNFINCVTWGQLQGMTQRFYTRECDESYAIITNEQLVNGQSLEHFDMAALLTDIQALAKK